MGNRALLVKLMSLDKEQIRLVVKLLTGHCNLQYHKWLRGLIAEPECPCGHEKQTAKHILCECPMFETERKQALGTPSIRPGNVHKLTPKRLITFVKLSGCKL
jgi:hypothetical protein